MFVARCTVSEPTAADPIEPAASHKETPAKPRLLLGRVAFVFAIAPWLGVAAIFIIRPG